MYSAPQNSTLQSINYTSARLRLTALTAQDEGLYCRLMTSPICMRFIRCPMSVSQALDSFTAILRRNSKNDTTQFYFKVALTATDQSIGIAAVNNVCKVERSADIGRILLPCCVKQGLGTELSLLIMKLLQKEWGITQFTKQIAPSNIAAIKSARKLGFVPDAEPAIDLQQHVCFRLKVQIPFNNEY